MGARYGGDINRRGRGTQWSPRKALEAVGRETRSGIPWKKHSKDQPQPKGRGTTA